jgi:hypothetical protein
MKIPFPPVGLAGLACILAAVSSIHASQSIALVAGDGYGRSEVQSLIRHVLTTELPDVAYEECGAFLAPADFSKYRMVVLAGLNSERRYTVEETRQIENYIRQGGNLLLINQSAKMLPIVENSDRDGSYLFGRSYYLRDNPTASVLQRDADILQGAFESGDQPSWLQGNVMIKSSEWDSLIGLENHVLVGRKTLDQGRVIYMGSELFRLMGNQKKEGGTDVKGWVRILTNILRPNQ